MDPMTQILTVQRDVGHPTGKKTSSPLSDHESQGLVLSVIVCGQPGIIGASGEPRWIRWMVLDGGKVVTQEMCPYDRYKLGETTPKNGFING